MTWDMCQSVGRKRREGEQNSPLPKQDTQARRFAALREARQVSARQGQDKLVRGLYAVTPQRVGRDRKD